MKVPNYEQAIVPKEKLTEYLLNFEHIDGKSKALFYQKYGFEKENFEDLIVSLKKIISENDFDNCNETPWGKKYVVFGYLHSTFRLHSLRRRHIFQLLPQHRHFQTLQYFQ